MGGLLLHVEIHYLAVSPPKKQVFSRLLIRIGGFGFLGSSSTFPVWFCNPIQIEPEIYYTATVILAGDELSYFGQVNTIPSIRK